MAQNPASVRIIIGGKDVTEAFRPWLISVTVEDKATDTDTAEIDLDDRYGVILLPAAGESIQVYFRTPVPAASDWTLVFQGRVVDLESYFARRNGRRLAVLGNGSAMGGAVKQRVNAAYGEGDEGGGQTTTIGEALTQAFVRAGISIMVDPALAALARPYIAQQMESAQAFGLRLAREVGAQLKIADGQASFTPIGGGMSADGAAMPGVEAVWGKNLIAWKIRPIIARPQYASAQSNWFDKPTSLWEMAEETVAGTGGSNGGSNGGGIAGAGGHGPFGFVAAGLMANHQAPHQSEDEATQQAGSDSTSAAYERGQGWVLINGEPRAHSGGTCEVSGARPGVDGSWTIDEVSHSWARAGGYTTRLTLMQPQGDAARDPRDPAWQKHNPRPFSNQSSEARNANPYDFGGPR